MVQNTFHPEAGHMAGVNLLPRLRLGTAVIVCVMLCQSGCHSQPIPSYTWDVYPILQQKWVACHYPPEGKGYLATGLDMTSYDSLMRGTRYGPVVIPGNSRHSLLNKVAEGRVHPSSEMARNLIPLDTGDEAILRQWVDSGAPNN